mgnify:CR=1 FL=1|jgi:large-conductance mechanosensitive channel|tara:strand:- start:969 stop:1238 length:270 start_codon:yes stop_codon:yes gene_type:complete
MNSEFRHFITDNFSSARVITVLVHTYIATLIYEIINPMIFSIIDPNEKLKNFKVEISNNKTVNLGRVLSDFITILLIFAVLFYLHKQKK